MIFHTRELFVTPWGRISGPNRPPYYVEGSAELTVSQILFGVDYR